MMKGTRVAPLEAMFTWVSTIGNWALGVEAVWPSTKSMLGPEGGARRTKLPPASVSVKAEPSVTVTFRNRAARSTPSDWRPRREHRAQSCSAVKSPCRREGPDRRCVRLPAIGGRTSNELAIIRSCAQDPRPRVQVTCEICLRPFRLGSHAGIDKKQRQKGELSQRGNWDNNGEEYHQGAHQRYRTSEQEQSSEQNREDNRTPQGNVIQRDEYLPTSQGCHESCRAAGG